MHGSASEQSPTASLSVVNMMLYILSHTYTVLYCTKLSVTDATTVCVVFCLLLYAMSDIWQK